MRFIRYFLFDLKQGVFHNKALLFTPAAIGALVFLDFFFQGAQVSGDRGDRGICQLW